MATRMMHEEHGYHIAYTKQEIAELEKLGWKRDPNWEKQESKTLTLKKPK